LDSGAVSDKTGTPPPVRGLLKRLRRARLDAGLRQEDVRRQIGTYESYVSKIESGERRVDIVELEELAKIYRKTIVFFLRRN